MASFFEALFRDILLTSFWEWVAVVTAIMYVILAANKHILCWTFALISSTIYVYLCWIGYLYIEAVLNIFYIAMAIFGWYAWTSSKSNNFIKIWKSRKHLINIILSGIIAYMLGFSFDFWSDQVNPYMDAFTTVYSLTATYMVVKRILENWIYWIIIDLVSIYLYFDRGYTLSSVLFVAYSILAIFGFFAWRKSYKSQVT